GRPSSAIVTRGGRRICALRSFAVFWRRSSCVVARVKLRLRPFAKKKGGLFARPLLFPGCRSARRLSRLAIRRRPARTAVGAPLDRVGGPDQDRGRRWGRRRLDARRVHVRKLRFHPIATCAL